MESKCFPSPIEEFMLNGGHYNLFYIQKKGYSARLDIFTNDFFRAL